MTTTNRPFRFAYLLFNPDKIISVSKVFTSPKPDMGIKAAFSVAVHCEGDITHTIRTIDEVEQEGTLHDFLTAWQNATTTTVTPIAP